MTASPHCRLCGDPLHLIAHEGADEYLWADEHGDITGIDSDLRRFGSDTGDAYTAWGKLREAVRAHQNATKKNPSPLTERQYRVAMESYIALNVRLSNGTWHTHVCTGAPPNTAPVPVHCDRPMWHRPSGWHCRAEGCGHVQPVD